MLSKAKQRTARQRFRLNVQSLEERTVPAFVLAIDGDTATANVSSVFAAGTTTFTATASGATLDVADVAAALIVGDVVIATGSTGAESGNVNWVRTSGNDDLSYAGATTRALTIRTDASSTSGAFNTNGVTFNFNDNINFSVDTTAPTVDGVIALLNDTEINVAASVQLNAGTNHVQLASNSISSMASSGNILITASTFDNLTPGFTLRSDLGNVRIAAATNLAGSLAIRAEAGTLDLNGSVNGAVGADLLIYGNVVNITGSLGSIAPLGVVTFAGGDTTFTGTISALSVNVGDGITDAKASTLIGANTITANVDVLSDGIVAPGGVGTTGAMNIIGSLAFDGGTFALDLGATPDLIHVSGNLTINDGTLGNASSTGSLTGTGDFKIADFAGALTGTFSNAPLSAGLLLGSDVIRVTHYGPAATGVTIGQFPVSAGGVATGTDLDGTGYKFKLSGPGQLIAFPSVTGNTTIVTRNTTKQSKVTLTTTANGSDNLVTLGPVVVNGDLGGFSAANGVLVDGLTAKATSGTTGALNSLSFYQVFSGISTPGAISSLTVGQNCFVGITADSIGSIKVSRSLSSFGDWGVTNGIKSISAAEIFNLNVTAKFIGTLNANGNKAQHIAGNITGLTTHLTGNAGSSTAYGLKSLTAKGNVVNSTFDVQEGSVGTVTVARFLTSNLYLDYTPAGAFNTGGTFASSSKFKLTKFTTTATTIGDATNPVNWAFAGSQIAADTIGTVRLTGLKTDNSGVAMGFKFRTAGGSIRTKTADSGAIPLNTNLSPNAVTLANDFYFLDI